MTDRFRVHALAGVAFLALVATPLTAQAQTAPGTEPASSVASAPASGATSDQAAAPNVGDIVVTAQRRKERLQSIPIAVTAFDQKAVKELHLANTLDVTKFVPSMISNHNAGLAAANTYYLRGLGNSQSVATFEAPVATYVNDIYLARQSANNYAFFDVQQIEVLRGPQGTLFGRNTTGGAVSLTLAKPTDHFDAKFEGTAGSYGRYTIKGTVDAPINDKVLTKTSAYYLTDNGYIKDTTTGQHLNGGKDAGAREDVRLLPTDQLTIDLAGEYTRSTDTYLGVETLPFASSEYHTTTTPVFYKNAAGMQKTSCDGNAVQILETTHKGQCALTQTYAGSVNAAYVTDAGTLNYIGSFRRIDQSYIDQYNGNVTNVYGGYIGADNNQDTEITQELKWNGNLMDNRLHYVTGLFYIHELSTDDGNGFTGTTTSTYFVPTTEYDFRQKIDSAAIYAQADYDITSKLTFTAGARYTWEKKTIEWFPSTRFAGLGYSTAQVIAAGIPTSMTQNRVTPHFALDYKLTSDILLYATITNGFKSGGWNGNAAVPTRVLPFKPEKTWSYEAGFKSELFDHRLRFNVNGFLANTKDIQITSGIIPPGETTIVSLARNAGTLRVYGAEIETQAALTRELNLFGNFTVEHGYYSKIDLTAGVAPSLQVQTSDGPVRVPTFQFSGGASYVKPVEALSGSIGGTATYRHNSPYWVALLNTAKAPTENYVDLSINYNHGDHDNWGVSLEVSNLTKQETITANFLSLFPGDPRRFTVRGHVNF